MRTSSSTIIIRALILHSNRKFRFGTKSFPILPSSPPRPLVYLMAIRSILLSPSRRVLKNRNIKSNHKLQSRRGKEKQKQGVFKFQTKEEILSRGLFTSWSKVLPLFLFQVIWVAIVETTGSRAKSSSFDIEASRCFNAVGFANGWFRWQWDRVFHCYYILLLRERHVMSVTEA